MIVDRQTHKHIHREREREKERERETDTVIAILRSHDGDGILKKRCGEFIRGIITYKETGFVANMAFSTVSSRRRFAS